MISPFGGKSPQIHASCFIAEGAHVIGNAFVSEGSSLWFNAVVRADIGSIRIGCRTNIQDLCVLHTDMGEGLVVGDDVTVGHRAILHGCTIGDRVLIGMGAVVMNGATIGDESIIGAGAVVTEGTIIPPRSLVLGMPAKVSRKVSDEESRVVAGYAGSYAELAAQYKKTVR